MRNTFNFSPGPAMLPEEVLIQAQQEFLDWHGCGMSVMEVSHRGKEFSEVAESTEATLREILAIPNNYKILFLAGGATTQFATVPMNLLRGKSNADYIVTGTWSKKAAKEAGKLCQVDMVATEVSGEQTRLPTQAELKLNPNAAYCYYTDNETIQGLEFDYIPDSGQVPLVADLTSNILSRPIDINQYGAIFASAQKNIGPSGITVVIVREDLMGSMMPGMPSLFDYALQAEQNSMLNTPPTFNWYMGGLMFNWVKKQGGVKALAELSERKINKIYQKIDSSDFYINNVASNSRSRMNVPFTLVNPALDNVFLSEAKDAGLVNLKGHRSVGGMRASVYLGMPEKGVDTLVEFMSDFEKRQG